MQNWQLTLVILASVLVGAAIPLAFLLARAVLRAGREIGAIGAQLRHTLARVDTISVRVEQLSRGLEGGETSVAELMTAVGTLSRSLDRNMKIINVLSTILASVGTAAAAYVQTRLSAQEARAHDGDRASEPADGPAPSSPARSQEASTEERQ